MTEQKQVDHQHAVYTQNQPKRDLFAAIMGGTDAIRLGTTKYLPKYPAEDATEYNARLQASTIDGIVANGVDGLCGKVFHEEPDVSKVNPAIVSAKLLENIDNEGNNFTVFARNAFKSAFDGFSIVLVDSPKAEGPVQSLADEQSQGIRPYWREYKAKDVTNWRWTVDPMTKVTRLALLVLREVTSEPDGPFAEKEVTRYRVYRHDQGVTCEVWVDTGDKTSATARFILETPPFALNLSAIPAAIIGDLDNEPWLMTEARLEVKAYQKESSFDAIEYLSIPILCIKGRTGEAQGQPMPYGPAVVVDVPADGDAAYVQIDHAGHTSLKGTIEGIKQEIAGKLDAVTNEAMPTTDETATAVMSDDSKSQARLIVWSNQLKDALERALQFTAEFMGMPGDQGGEIVLRTAWTVAQEKAQEQRDFDRTILTEEVAAKTAK